MASRVYLHVGLPKTGTTYLQTILWANRAALREQDILLPGRNARDHMWATLVVRQHPGLVNRRPAAQGSWQRIVEAVREHPGTAIVSHEFFGAATEEQAAGAIADLCDPDTELHLVVTARDVLTVVTSHWQEFVRHGFFERPLDEYPADGTSFEEWTWRTLDLEQVLRRWSATLPPERVHVLVVPGREAPRDALWLEFAELVGIEDAASLNLARAAENGSLAVVEAEFLRRVSAHLEDFDTALDRGVWVRSYLARTKLVPRGGERAKPSEGRIAELRDKGAAAATYIAGAGFDVRGDINGLLVPETVSGREPGTVTEAELLEVGAATVAGMMTDIRELRRENTRLRKEAEEHASVVEEAPAPRRSWLRRR